MGIPGWLKALYYVLSFLVAPAGVILGVVYLSREDKESKRLGRVCLGLGIAGFVVLCCCVLTLASVLPLGLLVRRSESEVLVGLLAA